VSRHKHSISSTIGRISNRSAGVRWDSASDGFALVLTPDGYVLTTQPDLYPDKMPARVVVPCEDGSPMQHRHVLTRLERERAIRAILGD